MEGTIPATDPASADGRRWHALHGQGGDDPGAFTRGPLSETLRLLEPHLAPELVGGAALSALEAALALVPAAVTDELYLECRLGPGEPRVDTVLHVKGPGRDILAGVNHAIPLPPPLGDHPAWARLRRFCGEWADPRSIFHTAVGSLWVELDLDDAPGGLEPGIFVDLSWLSARGAGPAEWTAYAASAAARLAGRAPAPGTIRAVRRCVEALPPGAAMTYAGFFPGRGEGAIRVCASGVGAATLRGYLRRAGWRGDPGPVLAALGDADPGPVPGYVHLDAHDGGPGPRLGVEVPFQRRAQLEGHIREAEWLRSLSSVAPEKAGALGRWPGWSNAVLPHQPWRSLLVRRVNHVKLLFHEGCAPQAKAYLAARHSARANRKEEEG
ncbi:hypothetical protein [Longimicrobium sp.]|uniref:hypothetical protein n=1 Tax=Longimicrobium sp. TaxID=2029185 RepID=UPI002CCF9EF7|nr:hypothetical protein [Longimicrobium sp.]HSU14667.1 hypothetical protein [Longimicrobium sp.]